MNIETYKYNGTGYKPLLITTKWQVSKLNYLPGHGLNEIDKIEIHNHTDEVFILLKGTGILIAANTDKNDIEFEVINMEPGAVYNLPRGTWHNIAMKLDAELIIAEDANTHLYDCSYKKLTDQQRCKLETLILCPVKCPASSC